MERKDSQQVHATAVLVDGGGVLLRGPSGAGKSDLALRLIDGGARLIADDRTDLWVAGGRLMAAAPKAIDGLLEVRGLGLAIVGSVGPQAIFLLVDLVAPAAVERLPEAACETILGLALPRLDLAPFEASAPAKLRLALARAMGSIIVQP